MQLPSPRPTASGTSTCAPSTAPATAARRATTRCRIDTTAPAAISGLSSSTHPSQVDLVHEQRRRRSNWSAGDRRHVRRRRLLVRRSTRAPARRPTRASRRRGDDATRPAASPTASGTSTSAPSTCRQRRLDEPLHAAHRHGGPDDAGGHVDRPIRSRRPGTRTTTRSSSWSGERRRAPASPATPTSVDQVADTTPDTVSEGAGTTTSFTALADGVWYFHVRAVDGAGQLRRDRATTRCASTPSLRRVPAPRLVDPSRSRRPGTRTTTRPSAGPATDAGLGVAGYSYALDQVADTTPDTVSEGSGTSTSYTDQADGIWYFHVRAVDNAGNWGATQHYTVRIDTTGPAMPSSASARPIRSRRRGMRAHDRPSLDAPTTPYSGVAGYSYILDQTSDTDARHEQRGRRHQRRATPARGRRRLVLPRARSSTAPATGAPRSTTRCASTPPAPAIDRRSRRRPMPSQATWYANNDPAFSWSGDRSRTPASPATPTSLDQTSNTTPDTSGEGTAPRRATSGTGRRRLVLPRAHRRQRRQLAARRSTTRCASTPRRRRASAVWRASTHAVAGDLVCEQRRRRSAGALRPTRAGSGVAGYSYVARPDRRPRRPTRASRARHGDELHPTRADGIWYFHVRAVDNAGNCRRDEPLHGAHRHRPRRAPIGRPGELDASRSRRRGIRTTTPALELERLDRRRAPASPATPTSSTRSPARPPTRSARARHGDELHRRALPTGTWYFHVRAVDDVGNVGRDAATTRCASTRVDPTRQRPLELVDPSEPGDVVHEHDAGARAGAASDAGSGVAGYSYILDQVAGTTPDTVSEAAARRRATLGGLPTASGTSTCAPSTSSATAARRASTTRCGSTRRRRSTAATATTAPGMRRGYVVHAAVARVRRRARAVGSPTTEYSTDAGVTWTTGDESLTLSRLQARRRYRAFVLPARRRRRGQRRLRSLARRRRDTRQPTTTNDAPCTPQTVDVTVTLTGTDPDSGVASTWYRSTAAPGRRARASSSVAMSVGLHTISYYSIDEVGNREVGIKVCTVTISDLTTVRGVEAPSRRAAAERERARPGRSRTEAGGGRA